MSLAALGLDLLLWGGVTETRWEFALQPGIVVATVVAGHTLSVLRPAWTIRPLLSLWVLGVAVAIVVPTYAPFAGLAVSLYRAASRYTLLGAVGVVCLTTVPFALNAMNSVDEDKTDLATSYLAATAVWGMLMVIPWALGRLSFSTAKRGSERERAKELEAITTLQAERLRLARELHDIVSHSVSAMILQAAGARAGSDDPARMRGALEAVETTGVQAMRELHRLLGLLRSVEEPQAHGSTALAQESLADLEPLLATVRACDVDVEVSTDGSPQPLDPSIDHAAYRVLQESLANVIKHAGRQASVRVHISWDSNQLFITVRNTPGLLGTEARPDLSTGLGLRGLSERVDLIGGRFEAGPASDGAFIVSAVLPWARTAVPTSSAVEGR